MSKDAAMENSLSERPLLPRPRRLADWLNPTGSKKVHSLIDKVYKKKNLELAWQRVKANRGVGGVDGINLNEFEVNLEENLERLHEELRTDCYNPQPVRQKLIPKPGQPEKKRPLGIPTIYDRVCQQALLNRLEPIFEPIFDDANFGYRQGRSTKDALRKIWKEIQDGNEWIVDADLQDFFGTADHEKLLTLVNQQVSDGRVLRLIRSMLEAGCVTEGRILPTEQGTPQGAVVSPLLSNILLTPFDWEMRSRGIQLTRYADDWVATCRSRKEAEAVLRTAKHILSELGVVLNSEKTRIVHVKYGFDFLGFRIKRGKKPLQLPQHRIKTRSKQGKLYAIPREKSVKHFKEQIRQRTRRRAPLSTQELIDRLNPVIRGWGNHYSKAHVRKLFNKLDRWIIRRIWSHRHKRWRCEGWKELSAKRLYSEFGLVNLVQLIPSIGPHKASL